MTGKPLLEKYSPLKQMVPSELCFTCDVCCRFPEPTSFLAPYFTGEEIRLIPGAKKKFFASPEGSKTMLIPHPEGEGCICPHFDPKSQHCMIYDDRPLDCRIYPFALMRDENGGVVLGIDLKCPFIQEHAGDAQMEADAAEVAKFLESDPIVAILAAHPRLIGRFQDDVLIVSSLEKVSRAVGPDDQTPDR